MKVKGGCWKLICMCQGTTITREIHISFSSNNCALLISLKYYQNNCSWKGSIKRLLKQRLFFLDAWNLQAEQVSTSSVSQLVYQWTEILTPSLWERRKHQGKAVKCFLLLTLRGVLHEQLHSDWFSFLVSQSWGKRERTANTTNQSPPPLSFPQKILSSWRQFSSSVKRA